MLDEAIGRLDRCFNALNTIPGKAGQSLTENDWLMSIRSRINIPGGTCEFDLPGYYAWQHRDAAQRQEDLERWASSLAPSPAGRTWRRRCASRSRGRRRDNVCSWRH